MIFYIIGFVLGVGYFIQVFFKEYTKSIRRKERLHDREYTEIHQRLRFYIYYFLLVGLSILYLIIEFPKEGTALWVGIAIFLLFYSFAKLLSVKNQFTIYDFGSSFLYEDEIYYYKNFDQDIMTTGFFLKSIKIKDTNRTVSIFQKGRIKINDMVNN